MDVDREANSKTWNVIGQTFCLSLSPDYWATVWLPTTKSDNTSLPPLTHVVTFNSSSLPEFVTNKWTLVGCETRSTKSSETAILTVIQLNFTYITLIECPSKNDTNKTQIRSYLFVNSKKTFAASKLFGPFLKVHLNSTQACRRIQ